MADLSGTILIGGNPPAHSVDVEAYAIPPDTYHTDGGLYLYDYVAGDGTDAFGNYTITGLNAGDGYHVRVIDYDPAPVCKASYFNGADPGAAHNYNTNVITIPGVGIDIPATAADDTSIVGTTSNCPPAIDFVYVMFIERFDDIAVGVCMGDPNGVFNALMIANDLYAEPYRVVAFGFNAGWNVISGGWYGGAALDQGGAATLVTPPAVINIDFGDFSRVSDRDLHFTVAPGAGAHFGRPRSTKSRLLRK